MIRWEGPQRTVECGHCGSSDTEVSFEFMAFTRHHCRACGSSFTTFTGRSGERGALSFIRRKNRVRKQTP
jgi:transposase-like protein